MTTKRGAQVGRFIWLGLLVALVGFGLGAAPQSLERLHAAQSADGLAFSFATLAYFLLLPAALLALVILATYVVRVDLLHAVERRWAARNHGDGADAERWKRRGRWLVPLLVLGAVFVVIAAIVSLVLSGFEGAPSSGDEVGRSFTGLGFSLLFWACTLFAVLLLFGLGRASFRGAAENRRESRHRRGKYTSRERERLDAQRYSHDRLTAALRFRDELLEQRIPQTVEVWDFRASPDEVFFQDAPATYARYYGRDVSYSTTSGFFFGSPAFVAAGLAVNALGNASARSSAEREAAEQWREWQTARVLVSNQRLICFAGGRWLSFWYSGVVASYPSLRERSLVLQFEGAEPLMLVGDHVPVAIMMATYSMHGARGLAGHPDLVAAAEALQPAPAPAPAPRSE
ncbi:hypothetical protein C5E10_01140 [Pseudoclavibacter sp. RFBG4]|uniref:hypothetical protein n=1 Tax=Pseudoclavibacter sp. RFBG4 TaxID=2080575 RepID=UPI000CE8C807|nr:hypothetical protein [Pseudoclavibacter sp. RFBG4]PPG36296.1 hypothetical protein C5E10_01140 [Pseudoclavibacter sp. RFBG4]